MRGEKNQIFRTYVDTSLEFKYSLANNVKYGLD